MLISTLIFIYLFFLLQRPSAGNALDKIVSGYQHIYAGQTDEDVVLSKCRNAISFLEKADKEIVHGSNSGMLNLITVIFFLIAVIVIIHRCSALGKHSSLPI